MSTTTDFVSELVRAANEVDKLTSFEITNLLSRSIATIFHLRKQAGIPSSGTPKDAIVVLREITNKPGSHTSAELAAAILSAADMIRTLYIVVESGVEIDIKTVR
ncbi:hypothetical protein [Rhizobium leguminosarum]|uniref:hypothetical protein n=1 Tax=Rhizobium leguminosarum TaxID=384 RepID=UPI003F9B0850